MGAVVGAVVLLIISGTFAASAQLWDVDSASDLEIGSEQQQVVTNIEVLDSNEPVEIHVGDLVDSGAELDHNATSYRIDIDEKTNRSEVYIENPNSSNATVVVSASAISSPGRFDLYISNIDTTNVSKYDEEGAKINRDLSYTAEQGGKKASVGFSISSLGSIGFKSDTYNQSTQSVFYNYSTNNNQSLNTAVTIWEEEQDGSLGEKIKTVETSSKNISLRDTDIEGETKIIIGLHSSPDKHSFNAIYALDSTTINVSVPAQLVGGPFYYGRVKLEDEADEF
ncbi:hypothetical protein [Halorubrum distributum]|uniref:hypothetical protein n=1 Tax=Halorubrum distributum TaxID=29283 RepID=UPI00126873F5|nr:hypothetical protein [Halorubrum terrestre]